MSPDPFDLSDHERIRTLMSRGVFYKDEAQELRDLQVKNVDGWTLYYLAEDTAAAFFVGRPTTPRSAPPRGVQVHGPQVTNQQHVTAPRENVKPRSVSPVKGLPRTGSALKTDPYHAFPDMVDNFAGDAQRFLIPTKGPGGTIVRQSELYQLKGHDNDGKSGVYEWVVDQGQVTHRRFIPGGAITGFPNQAPGAR